MSWGTHHCKNFVFCQTRFLAEFKQREFLDSADDTDTSTLSVTYILVRASSLAGRDLILLVGCGFQPVIACCEFNVEAPHYAVLILDSFAKNKIQTD